MEELKQIIDYILSEDMRWGLIVIGCLILLMILIIVLDYIFRNSSTNKQDLIEDSASVNEDETIQIQESSDIIENTVEEPTEPKNVEMLVDSNSIQQQEPVKEEIKYVEDDPKITAQLELQKVTEELVNNEDQVKNIDLTNFEIEQEENAIISLQELLAKGETLYDQNEVKQYEDEGNEPINLKELEMRYQESKQEEKNTVVLEEFVEQASKTKEIEQPKKFKSSPIISPIYGIKEEHLVKEESIELENTANYDKLDEEIKKTNEFLQILKELQKKLD